MTPQIVNDIQRFQLTTDEFRRNDVPYIPNWNYELLAEYIYGERNHSLPKDKILIDRNVAEEWVNEMLAQAKYARLSGKTLVDLLNELRKALGAERGTK